MTATYGPPLEAAFYGRSVVEVSRELLGCVVVHGDAAGVIVETEAYHESEPACHAYVGLTARTHTLFEPPGLAYVYRSYGIHALLNAVAEEPGVGAAALIRALEPVAGLEGMRSRRGLELDLELCSGPGKLTQALGISLEENATDLCGAGPITIHAPPPRTPAPEVAVGLRVGITKAAELPWRFAVAHSPYVSRPRLPLRRR